MVVPSVRPLARSLALARKGPNLDDGQRLCHCYRLCPTACAPHREIRTVLHNLHHEACRRITPRDDLQYNGVPVSGLRVLYCNSQSRSGNSTASALRHLLICHVAS